MMKKMLIASILMIMMLAVPFVSALDRNGLSLDRDELRKIQNDPTLAQDRVPETASLAESNIAPDYHKFILYTHTLDDVLLGKFGNGYFKGEDNHGNSAWGIYGAGIFAGFYEQQFFYGKYRGNRWVAIGLFNKKISHGKFDIYVNRPEPEPEPSCRDSDGGFNVRKKGTVVSCIQTDKGRVCDRARDYCADATSVVVETFCKDDGTIGREKFECPHGCKNGACTRPDVCTDEYEPVCGTNQVRSTAANVQAQKLTTYSNKCELVRAGAVFLYEGECERPVLDTELSSDAKPLAADALN